MRVAAWAPLVSALLLTGAVVSCSDDPKPSSTSSGTNNSTTSTSITGSGAVTRLPVGDNRLVTTPTVGSIFACRTGGGGGGASAQGPWFNGDGTWDLTKKVFVDGDVRWDAASATFAVRGDMRVITSNALPAHGTGVFPISPPDDAYQYDRNPNTITSQTLSISNDATPTAATTPSCLGGEVGIASDGVPIFNGFDAGNRDAAAWEVQDQCHGHPQMSGIYHYHDISPCLDDAGTGHSKLVGYAFDGFGIYGPRGEDGTELTTAGLDVCHGHTHTIEWDGQQVEMYHYHATKDFPYTASCFHGTSTQQGPLGRSVIPGRG
jgi:hypothetical protein